MDPFAAIGLTVLASYLLGAIPFGYLVARMRGVDILHQGSGNIGATNVGRLLGKKLGILVFLLDFAKGALPVAAAMAVDRWLDRQASERIGSDALPVAAGLAAFLGHLFPVYLRFRGGKGVATGAGVVSVLVPVPALAGLLAWIAVVCASRCVSLASLVAVVVLCIARLLGVAGPFAPDHVILTIFCVLAAALVVLRHRANVQRLLQGKENRLPDSPTMLTFTKTVHLLSLGLWFGMMVFFIILGLTLFKTFDDLASQPAPQRPYWLPVPADLNRDIASKQFPQPLRKEQGGRVAGAAVVPLFPWYFGIQAACGMLALATALAWRREGKVGRLRVTVLAGAAILVALGWAVERQVSELRETRNQLSDLAIHENPRDSGLVPQAEAARAEFGLWHGASLLLNFVTLLLVTAGMVLAAKLPGSSARVPEAKQPASAGSEEPS